MSGNTVYVGISGETGSGKTAIYMEIMVALKALGLNVVHADPAAFGQEINLGRGDGHDDLTLYKPTVVLSEVNVPRIRRPGGQHDHPQPGSSPLHRASRPSPR